MENQTAFWKILLICFFIKKWMMITLINFKKKKILMFNDIIFNLKKKNQNFQILKLCKFFSNNIFIIFIIYIVNYILSILVFLLLKFIILTSKTIL